MKKYIFIFSLLFAFTFNVQAECNDEDLLEYAENVQLKYKEVEDDSIDYLYYLYVDPKRDDIELSSTNSLYSGVTEGIEIENNFGVPSRIHFEEKTYTVEVYGGKKSNCPGELLTTLTYTVQPYNYYSNTQFCYDNPEADICQKMADTKDLSNEEFAKEAQEYIDSKNDEEKEHSLLYIIIFEYLIWLLVPALIIGFIYYKKINKVKKVKDNE